MGNMSDGMRSIVDEIRSSKEARSAAGRQLREDIGVRLSEIRSDTHNLMERFHREGTERKTATGEMLGDFRKADTERKATVDELKGNTKDMMKDFHKANSELKGNVKDMLGDFHQANSEFKGAVSEMVREFASDHRQAHQIWTEGLKGRIKPKAAVEEAEEKPKVKEKPKAEVGPPDVEKVLEVITGHAEGIRLIDIGNELGVDWRTLIGATKSLVDGGQVEKIENMYYPKKEE